MPTALFISPHLDDAIFSAGGLAGLLADRGWRTVLVTVFTGSVVPAAGFALACQLDKGLAPDVDYMAVRREEDRAAAAILSFTETRWMGLLEAPHRGYHSAKALFGHVLSEDSVALVLTSQMRALRAEFEPTLVLAPQGLGNHVDHQHVTAAVVESFPANRLAFYRDTPYAIREAEAVPLPVLPEQEEESIDITAALDRKILAAQAYASQIGFQFGGAEQLARALRSFARREGGGTPAERYLGEGLEMLADAA
ncbi:PIG-L deacetylase family protein [Acidisphaera sp. L21]|uniref:PIG-L deacetylase family protein n=1 Tax=Acidisphaera sp. L21 TaxID=1641851 RepID=UPI00131B17C6|nr:PIG-L family deacetylase [Acidisphaera sp. L21]